MSGLLANRYAVVSELGMGGMGVVYAVRDTLDGDRALALKTIRQEAAITRHQRLRFKEEFLAMARLRHPNTVEVYDFGQLDETSLYLTMEIVPGQELTALVGDRGMPIEKACRLLVQLLQALAFVHARGYLHRDIKAENIRVRDDGTLKLMDFGLMTPLGAPGARQISGSPGYLPPETVTGGPLTPAADLYAVGCLAYLLLTGRLPFQGRLMEIVRAHAGQTPEPLRRHRPELPESLETLVAHLLAKDPGARPATAEAVIAELAPLAGAEVARASAEQQKSFLTTSVLVGRDAELGTLLDALASARQGTGAAYFVGAPAGVGKSRLLAELAIRAKLDEVVVLHGSCPDVAAAPYQGAAEALKPLLAASSAAEREAHAAAIAGLYRQEGACAQTDLKEGLGAWIEAVASRQPVVWIQEDLHWADAPSLALVNQLARRAAGTKLLLVASFRNDEAPAGSAVWHTIEEGTSHSLKLGPLTPQQQREVLTAMLREVRLSEDFAQALYQATGGNACFLTAIVQALLEDGLLVHREGAWHFPLHPDVLQPLKSVSDAVARRVSHLCAGARALAAAAAVVGAHQDLDLLLAVSTLDEDVFFERLDELIERQFILKQGEAYAFPHARIREALYEGLDPADRRALHQRAGEYLEARQAADPAAAIYELAYHFAGGEDAEKAFHYAMAAGNAADEAGADAIALEHWLRAEALIGGLDLPDRAERQRALWRLIGPNGFVLAQDAAFKAFEALIEDESRQPEPDRLLLAEYWSLLCGLRSFRGQVAPALQASETAVALVAGMDPAWVAAIRSSRVTGLMLQGRYDEAIGCAVAAVEVLGGVDLTRYPRIVGLGYMRSLAVLNARVFIGEKTSPEAEAAAIAAAAAIGDHSPLIAPSFGGLYAAWSGRQGEAQAYIDAASRMCRQIGAPPYQAVLYLVPYLAWQRGEYDVALSQLEKALAAPHMGHIIYIHTLALALRGQVLLDMGELNGAQTVFRDLHELGAHRDMGATAMQARYGLGLVALARGERETARSWLTSVLDASAAGPMRNPLLALRTQRALADLAVAERRFEEAEALLRSALATATDPLIDNPIEAAHTHRALGDRHHAAGDAPAAHRAWRSAGAIYHQLGNMHGLSAVTRELEGLTGRVPAVEEAPTPVARWQMMANRSFM